MNKNEYKLPLYNAFLDAEEDGLLVMSLVERPATEFNWLCFEEDKRQVLFSVQDEDKHILCGVVMLADTPIYRRDADGFEYYIQYSKETLEQMAEKMLFNNTFNTIDIQHNGEILPKGAVVLRELFIKDSERGICPKGFEEVKDGSLLCTYKVNDEQLWGCCTNGTFNGFSLEGYFTVAKVENFSEQKSEDAPVQEDQTTEQEIYNLIELIKEKLKK